MTGPHRLLVGDITQGAIAEVMFGERADAVYSDPPWGEGNVRFWRTHAGQDPAPHRWATFRDAWVFGVTRVLGPGAPLFVEMGERWAEEFAGALGARGVPVRSRWTTQYRAGAKLLPCALLYAGPTLPEGFDPSGLRGAALPRACLGAVRSMLPEAAIVLDPCCGKGFTAAAALAHGLRFRGVELNAARAAVTAARLRKGAQ